MLDFPIEHSLQQTQDILNIHKINIYLLRPFTSYITYSHLARSGETFAIKYDQLYLTQLNYNY